jgi:hypothetical protein
MTRTQMHTKLGLRLEDTGENNFNTATKDSALNSAQRMVANFLHEAYLTELEFKDSVTISGTGGLITLDGGNATNKSSQVPIRNSIRAVQLGTKYAIRIPFSDAKKLENEYLGADSVNPVYWVFGNNVTIRPNAQVGGFTSAVLYYLKTPTDMAPASGGTAEVQPILNSALHDIMIDLAEAELWRMDNKPDRSQLAKASAMEQIKMLNDRYAIEQPTGVGHDMG